MSSRWTLLGVLLATLPGPESPSGPRVLVATTRLPARTRPSTATRRVRSAAGPWTRPVPRRARAA
eukprot:10133947-Alexandrium_andersonii.AAC.1